MNGSGLPDGTLSLDAYIERYEFVVTYSRGAIYAILDVYRS